MSIQHGKTVTDGSMPLRLPSLEKMLPYAVKRAQDLQTIYLDRKQDCGVEYTENHHEIQMWHLALLQAEYVAGLLVQKVEDGHCYHHKPCDETAKLHLTMLRDYKKALEELTGDIQKEIDRVEAKWKTPAPTASQGTGS